MAMAYAQAHAPAPSAPITLPVQNIGGPITLPVQTISGRPQPPALNLDLARRAAAGGVDPSWFMPQNTPAPASREPAQAHTGGIPTLKAEEEKTIEKASPAQIAGTPIVGLSGQDLSFTPAGAPNDKPTTTPAHTTLDVDPERRKELEEAGGKTLEGVGTQIQAVKNLGEAAANEAEQTALGHEKAGKTSREGADTLKDLANRNLAELAGMRNTINEMSAAAAKEGIDPTKDFSGWDHVRLTLASILGGALQGGGFTKTNQGLEAIQQKIAQSVEAQKIHLQQNMHRIQTMHDLYASAYKATGSHFEAQALSEGMLYKSAEQDAAAMAARAGSPMAQARALELQGKLEEHFGDRLNQLMQERVATEKRVPEQTAPAASTGLDMDKIDYKALETLSKDYHENKIPETEEAIKELRTALTAPGGVTGIGGINRLPGVSGIHAAFSPQADINQSKLKNLATYLASNSGKGGFSKEKYDHYLGVLQGSGSTDRILAGLDMAAQENESKTRTVRAAHSPATLMAFDLFRQAQQRGRNQPQEGASAPVSLPGGGAQMVSSPDEVVRDKYGFPVGLPTNPEVSGKEGHGGGGKGSAKKDTVKFPRNVPLLK